VGDALQSLAFETLAAHDSGIAPRACAEMVRVLASSSGARGMAGGQALDLQAVGVMLDIDELSTLHRLKTGALIASAVKLGALCGGQADAATITQLGNFADNIGVAFQIVDDILDEVMDSETLGKTGGQDRARDKPTYTTMLGLDEARRMTERLHKTALESLATIRHNTETLRDIADFVVNRRF
jgi:farnesyl diphosphate synthase